MDEAVRLRARRGAAGRRRAAFARVRELRHVPQLRAPRAKCSSRRCARSERRGRSVFYADVKPRAPLAEYDQRAGVGRRAAAGARAGDGVFVLDRDRRRQPRDRLPAGVLPRAARPVRRPLASSRAVLAFQVPLRVWQQAAPYLFLLGAGFLVLVLVPGIGREVNGSRRWISLQFVTVQPSEFMKLFVVLYAADYTVRKAAHMASFRKGFLPMFVVMLVVGGAAAARARFRRVRGDRGDRDGHPVPRRHELAALRRPDRAAAGRASCC